MSEYAIDVQNVSKIYKLYDRSRDRLAEALHLTKKKLSKDHYALDQISFQVKKGETVGIIGTNGSGKSTILKIITGVLNPTGGKVDIDGRISALLELGAGFNMEYTGIENVYLNGTMIGFSEEEIKAKLDSILEFADIGDFVYQPVKTYSSGMFARLAFAVAINVEPDILIVDEALSVGDLFFQNKCFRKFEELKAKGVTILFVSHDIASVRQMCSRALWIDHGTQKKFGDCDLVCDMYMDEKRKSMNEGVTMQSVDEERMTPVYPEGKAVFPALHYKSSKLVSESFRFLSCFITDSRGAVTTDMLVENEYEFHMVIEFFEDMDHLIAGFVFENNKGLPIYDINNYINQGQTWKGVKGQVTEIVFKYRLPRIMKGTYVVSAALAQGTQERHIMLTWLHGALEVTIYNEGYNSSYIEIPSEIQARQFDRDQIEIVGEEKP